VQTPAEQPLAATLEREQTVPHAPQLAGSTAVLAQKVDAPVPQVRRGEAQVALHAPPEHTRPAGQAAPQTPQLALSVRVLTSQPSAALALQSAKPAAQAAMAHTPEEQVAVALGRAQARPQAPQLVALVWVLVSQPLEAEPSQSAKPTAQRTTVQVLAEQPLAATLGRAHTVPHAPQLAGSTVVLAQKAEAPLQVRRGAAQLVPQRPPEQTEPAGQATLHAPQLALLARVFTSQPLLATPSQSAKPGAQAAMAQAPAAQVEAALGSAQTRPQAPQFEALEERSASQPLEATPSQSPKAPVQRTTVQAPEAQPLAATWERAQTAPHAPQWAGSMEVLAQKVDAPVPQVERGEAQLALHVPPEQTWPAAQALPHTPQLALSVRVLTSQPSEGLALQSAKPVAQAAIAQPPAVQVAVALGRAHILPQAPQLATLVWVLVSQPLAGLPSQSP